MARLAGKVALVTGAARGIGRGIAERFAVESAMVGVLDLNLSDCQLVVDDIQAAGGQAMALQANITDEVEVEAAVTSLCEHFGSVTVLVNNAAVMVSKRLHDTTPDEFDRVVNVNLRGTYLVSRAVIPGMIDVGGGSIIHMSSITGTLGLPGTAIYGATKGALTALARAMAIDYAECGIRVNAVSPGTIDSPMLQAFLAAQADPDAIRAEFNKAHPVGRVGTIDEVADVFVFLASDELSFVTGTNIAVDGGASVKGEQPQDETGCF